jgi:hypothetical protein
MGNRRTLAKKRSDTALFGHMAYKLEGITVGELPQWERELSLGVGDEALRKAPSHAGRLQGSPAPQILRKTLAIDWAELNFFTAVVRLRCTTGSGALARLDEQQGVLDVYTLDGSSMAIVIVVYERRHDKVALEAKLFEFGTIEAWELVDSHRREGAALTCKALAKEAAAREKWSA